VSGDLAAAASTAQQADFFYDRGLLGETVFFSHTKPTISK